MFQFETQKFIKVDGLVFYADHYNKINFHKIFLWLDILNRQINEIYLPKFVTVLTFLTLVSNLQKFSAFNNTRISFIPRRHLYNLSTNF